MALAGPAVNVVINMASIHGTVAAIGNGAYTAARHGVVGLTKNAAAQSPAQIGLRINCVGPAHIETPLLPTFPLMFGPSSLPVTRSEETGPA